jgi:AAA+ superfamily predicted ATPase
MTNNIDNLFLQSLTQPTDAIAYYFGLQLADQFAAKAMLQGSEYQFQLEEYVEAGHCRAVLNPAILPQIDTDFEGAEEGLSRSPKNAWYHVAWQDAALDVVFLSWHTGSCEHKHYWILADMQEIAERFFLEVCLWASEVRGEVLVFQEGYWAKSKALFQSIRNTNFDNLILPARLKQEIQNDFAHFFASREIYEKYGIPWKRGVLLIGPPGNGKSHTVKALVNWLHVPCLYVKSFQSEYRNDQRNIHSVFKRARQTTPCILVLEDLDSLINDKNRSYFLNELDGFAANTGIVVLATTNHPERLDPAILNRPSRFDRKYYFELPALEERIAYIRAWIDFLEPDLRLSALGIDEIAAATEGFSFAYLKELFLSAMMRWIARPGALRMEAVMQDQCIVLREQMSHMTDERSENVSSDDSDELDEEEDDD